MSTNFKSEIVFGEPCTIDFFGIFLCTILLSIILTSEALVVENETSFP